MKQERYVTCEEIAFIMTPLCEIARKEGIVGYYNGEFIYHRLAKKGGEDGLE